MASLAVKAEIDTLPLYDRMGPAGQKKLVFDVVQALRNTLLKAQEAVNLRVSQKFTIRQRAFLIGDGGARKGGQAAIIKPFPNVGQSRIYGEIAVGHPKGGTGPLLIARFEDGGEREPFKGVGAAAVPVIGGPARPSFGQSVEKAFRFSQLNLREVSVGAREARLQGREAPHPAGARVFHGRYRTFELSKTVRQPHGAVFQRIGPGPADLRLVYVFRSGEHLDRRLEFVSTVQQAIHRWFPEYLQQQALLAIAHSRSFA